MKPEIAAIAADGAQHFGRFSKGFAGLRHVSLPPRLKL